MKHYVVIGLIPGDDDETAMYVGQHLNKCLAVEDFRAKMHALTGDQGVSERVTKKHGIDIFVEAVITSDTPMEVEVAQGAKHG